MIPILTQNSFVNKYGRCKYLFIKICKSEIKCLISIYNHTSPNHPTSFKFSDTKMFTNFIWVHYSKVFSATHKKIFCFSSTRAYIYTGWTCLFSFMNKAFKRFNSVLCSLTKFRLVHIVIARVVFEFSYQNHRQKRATCRKPGHKSSALWPVTSKVPICYQLSTWQLSQEW